MNPRKRLRLKKIARQKTAQAVTQVKISLPTEVDLITDEEPAEVKTKPIKSPRVVAKEVDNTISKKKAIKTTKTTSKGE